MHRESQPTEPPPGGGDPLLDHQRAEQRTRQTRVAKLIVALFLVVVFILFIVQNSKRTPIDYVFFHRQTRLIWIMLSCGVLGGVVGYLVGRPGKQVRIRRKKKQPPAPQQDTNP